VNQKNIGRYRQQKKLLLLLNIIKNTRFHLVSNITGQL